MNVTILIIDDWTQRNDTLKSPRIIIFSGKGGVGKTTVAAATGLRCAELGLKTVIISIDIAHSLADSFRLDADLQDNYRGRPRPVRENLWIQEVDIQEELTNHWGDVSSYLAALLGSGGMADVMAQELAIIPGMEDVISLLYINQYYNEKTYDVIVIDCAPTGESLRFISMPTTLEWYINKVFRVQRNVLRAVRPIAKRLVDIPLPEDSYFASLYDLFTKLDGVDKVLLDKEVTSVRLVTNAERMVLRETQRAYMYFCLYGLLVDTIVVNRLFPNDLQDEFFSEWIKTQQRNMAHIKSIFDPVPIRPLAIMKDEVSGLAKLEEVARLLYGEANPAERFHDDTVYSVHQENGVYSLRLTLPFVKKENIDLYKEEGDLVIRIGSFKRHVFLPKALAERTPGRAYLRDNTLTIPFS